VSQASPTQSVNSAQGPQRRARQEVSAADDTNDGSRSPCIELEDHFENMGASSSRNRDEDNDVEADGTTPLRVPSARA